MDSTICNPEKGCLPGVRSATRPHRRAVLGIAAALVFAVATGGTPVQAAPKAKDKKAPPATMLPITIQKVVVLPDGTLQAQGLVGNQPFTAPVTLAPAGVDPDGCPILDLALGPINLDLLGLVVDTSPICLSITAIPGGGLLGDLLCGVAGLLNPDGLNLGTILGGLTNAQLTTLLDSITGLLNGALGAATAPNANTAVTGTQAGACDVLSLSVGPLDLTLLGLNVVLDDCDGGPVTVDITAERGAGNLLGNLLCNLGGLLDGPANGNAIANALNRVADAIGRLVDAL